MKAEEARAKAFANNISVQKLILLIRQAAGYGKVSIDIEKCNNLSLEEKRWLTVNEYRYESNGRGGYTISW